ncbi:MAG: L-asparaginase [Bradyrhizobium sp.]|jgi:L-asparaginase|nr:L-asparaginase [Bradyrhizobium sp.]
MSKEPKSARDQFTAKPQTIAKVYVLYTGGTFGMALDLATPGNPLRPMELERLKQALPEPGELVPGVRVTLERFDRLLDSSSMTPNDWVNIARKIEQNYDVHDGFIVIQGTDTLSYTASALSFMLENLAKPVVITGSQLPLPNARTDAKLNYGHALQIAAYKATDLPCIPEVIVVFADKILRGCRTRKMSASAWTGFESPNCPPLGEIGEHIRIFENQIRRPPPIGLDLQVNYALHPDVLDISLYPGLRPEHLQSILSLDSVKGVVLRTYGTGNAPEDESFLSALRAGIRIGNKTVVNITQCPQGTVEMGLYAASIGLLDSGVISGLDMTPEAALTKLMVTMGTRMGEQVKLQMQINQRGEQSQNLFDYNFATVAETDKPFSDFIVPDRRFDLTLLSAAVLRMKNLKVTVPDGMQHPVLDVYMNFPTARAETLERDDHPRRLHRIELLKDSVFDVVEQLSKERVKNVVGDSDVALTLVASPGVKFGFDKLSLSMFTRT